MGKKHDPKIIRDEAVLFYERGHTFAETQVKYGMAESTFFVWKKKYDQDHPLHATGCTANAARRTRLHSNCFEITVELVYIKIYRTLVN